VFGSLSLVGVLVSVCCGGLVPLGLVLGVAGAAGVLTGVGVLGAAIVSAAGVALVAAKGRRACSPEPVRRSPSHRRASG
jgi:hypothetical protein